MRLLLVLAAIISSGCQTAEIALDHQLIGIRVVAKFTARDRPHDSTNWNGGDPATLRR